MSNESTLRLKIDGRPGEIDLKALEKSIGAILKLISAVGGKDVPQHVKELSTGSAIIDVLTEEETASLISTRVSSLAISDARPTQFNRRALDAINELYKVTTMPGVAGVSFGEVSNPIVIGAEVARHATEAISKVRESLGSVKRMLYKFNGRKGNLTAGIEDSRTGRTVELELEETHVKTALHLLQSEVLVRGKFQRDPLTNQALSIKVRDVKQIGSMKIQRPAREVQGILGTDWFDGLSPVEIVRQERGA